MKKIKWGVLSTAKIGTEKVIPAMQKGFYSDVTAIASRNIHSAKTVAKKLGISKAYGSYEELLADPDIDAIYNPLPNHLHVPFSIKSIESGKHVLCEKPIGLNTIDAKKLLVISNNHPELKVMEAFMYRFHPQWQKVHELVQKGSIGNLRTIQSFFSYSNTDSCNIRNSISMGGGALMDIGCYPISLSRWLFGSEPKRVLGSIEKDPQFEVDRLTSGVMDFENGTSTFTCSTQIFPHQRVTILGTEGSISIDIPFNAPTIESCKIKLCTNKGMSEISFEPCNHYTLQGDLVSKSILDDTTPPTPLSDSIANMEVIDALFYSSQSNTWELVGNNKS